MLNYYYKKNIINKLIQVMLMLIAALPITSFAQDTAEIQIAQEFLLTRQKQKAFESYRALAKNGENISIIHNDYLNLLLDMGKFEEAENYVDKLIKRSDKTSYKLDLALVYQRAGDLPKADKQFKAIIKNSGEDVFKLKQISDYFGTRDLIEYSILAILQAREVSKNSTLFILELANLYRLVGKKSEMVTEYLSYVTQTPGNSGYIKNLLQVLLTKQDELETLEQILYSKSQQMPDNENYADLLIWVNLQKKNFNGAVIQSKSYDKRFKRETIKTNEIAQIAFNNKSYEAAEKAYRFVIKEYPNSPNNLTAKLGLLKTREARIKEQYPINRDSVQVLINNYADFIKAYPENPNSLEATGNEALLYGYYLDQKEKAITILTILIANPKLTLPALKAKWKLDLGDIYALKQEPWEASLLYSQVEKTQKETPMGYDAKLKNAKLSYYSGDFKLAQEHLDILKKATTREIANDALELSLRIKENTAVDTLGFALKEYAQVELLLNQNKTLEGLARLQALKQKETGEDSTKTRESTLLDDIFWLEANLRLKQGDFTTSIELLQQIIKFFPDDVLADDAAFLQADIIEKHLKDKTKAMELYRDFLNRYPGSVYSAEARKRYRELRGDFSQPVVN
jgi:TolA-binding protein